MKILKLKPFYSERIWGGQKLKEMGFDIPNNKKIGEVWALSAHPNGVAKIIDEEFDQINLDVLFNTRRELFDNYKGDFPLLVKIIAASDYLSVQVHPSDDYALKRHNQLGKPESWYVLDAPKDGYLIYGHSAKNKIELEKMIYEDKWDNLLVKVPVKKGDFFYVPPGKIHAITPGVIVYELQRSSDITYRLYDYNRVDEKGNARELHIEDSICNTQIPDRDGFIINNASKKIISNNYFSLYKLNASDEKEFMCDEKTYWLQFTVINGSGTINGKEFKSGDCAISIEGVDKVLVTGNLEILISWIKK